MWVSNNSKLDAHSQIRTRWPPSPCRPRAAAANTASYALSGPRTAPRAAATAARRRLRRPPMQRRRRGCAGETYGSSMFEHCVKQRQCIRRGGGAEQGRQGRRRRRWPEKAQRQLKDLWRGSLQVVKLAHPCCLLQCCSAMAAGRSCFACAQLAARFPTLPPACTCSDSAQSAWNHTPNMDAPSFGGGHRRRRGALAQRRRHPGTHQSAAAATGGGRPCTLLLNQVFLQMAPMLDSSSWPVGPGGPRAGHPPPAGGHFVAPQRLLGVAGLQIGAPEGCGADIPRPGGSGLARQCGAGGEKQVKSARPSHSAHSLETACACAHPYIPTAIPS